MRGSPPCPVASSRLPEEIQVVDSGQRNNGAGGVPCQVHNLLVEVDGVCVDVCAQRGLFLTCGQKQRTEGRQAANRQRPRG